MSSAAEVNNSIDEPMNQSLVQEDQQRTPKATTTSNVLITGSFVGVGDGIHNAEGIAKVFRLEDGNSILRLEKLHVTNGLIYKYTFHLTRVPQIFSTLAN